MLRPLIFFKNLGWPSSVDSSLSGMLTLILGTSHYLFIRIIPPSFLIEFTGVTLANKTIQVSSVQLHKTLSARYIMRSPPEVKSLFIPVSPQFAHFPLPPTLFNITTFFLYDILCLSNMFNFSVGPIVLLSVSHNNLFFCKPKTSLKIY